MSVLTVASFLLPFPSQEDLPMQYLPCQSGGGKEQEKKTTKKREKNMLILKKIKRIKKGKKMHAYMHEGKIVTAYTFNTDTQ